MQTQQANRAQVNRVQTSRGTVPQGQQATSCYYYADFSANASCNDLHYEGVWRKAAANGINFLFTFGCCSVFMLAIMGFVLA